MEPYVKETSQVIPYRYDYYRSVRDEPFTTSSTFRGEWRLAHYLHGVKNPNWRSAVKLHEGAGTPMDAEHQTLKLAYGEVLQEYEDLLNPTYNPIREYDAGILGVEMLQDPFTSFGSLPDVVYNRCLTRFYKNAWKKLRMFQGGVFLGELKETLHMIRNPAKALRSRIDDYVRAARQRYKRSSPRRRRNVLANTWLEYSFGMLPLMGDIKNGAEALAENFGHFRSDFEPVRAFDRSEEQVSINVLSYQVDNYGGGKCFRLIKNTCESRIIGQVSVSASGSLMDNRLFGFSLNDFIPTVWELIPYSFLIDYFTNIGDVLESWCFPTGALRWTNTTKRSFASCEVSFVFPDLNGATWNGGNSRMTHSYALLPPLSFTRKFVHRDQLPIGMPVVSFELPGLGTQFLNIGALAAARFLK